jgi:hypothetical protein
VDTALLVGMLAGHVRNDILFIHELAVVELMLRQGVAQALACAAAEGSGSARVCAEIRAETRPWRWPATWALR